MFRQAPGPTISVWNPSFDPHWRGARPTGGFFVTVLKLVAGPGVFLEIPR